MDNGDVFGYDIPGTSRLAKDREECQALCQETEHCSAVTFKKFSQKCWMKNAPEDATTIIDWASSSIKLCPEDILSGAQITLPYVTLRNISKMH